MAALLLTTSACSNDNAESSLWNNPYPASEQESNILYSAFSSRPKHLDPVQSYSSNEYQIHNQIYEPVVQYHYLKRPYELTTLTAKSVPIPTYENKRGQQVAEDADDVAYSIYTITIKPGIMYQPHPAFAKNAQGEYRYHNLTSTELDAVHELKHFTQQGSKELTADDYVYQIKRLAHPKLHSPILSIMDKYIVGLKDYTIKLKQEYKNHTSQNNPQSFFDISQYDIEGVTLLDKYTYRIKIKGKYPQFLYWLAMPFFAPIAKEVDVFYSQPGMKERNITLDWYPVGTGPYMLIENNPNRQMVLARNPNFHDEYYPTEGQPEDKENQLLVDGGKKIPFIDKIIYSLEKESIPTWNKFLQGYYDLSGVGSDSFDKAIQFAGDGAAELTPDMLAKGIALDTDVEPSTFYVGFNMLDEVIGGYGIKQQKLRQAISIALDYEDFISIFLNGRGIVGQSPIPPGIFGFAGGEKGVNPYTHEWRDGKIKRKSIAIAKRLLAEAGYPNGLDVKTGKPLLLNFDITASGPEDKAKLDWFRKQFAKLNLQLIFRDTDYNRFQEKMRKGTAQMFQWGWNADYPDPENFLFLLYGPNSKVKSSGENAANYNNPEFNKLFDKMKSMRNSPQRLQVINDLIEIARRDAPWVWSFHPKEYVLKHSWVKNYKPHQMLYNTIKYRRVDAQERNTKRHEWNQPEPGWIILILILLLLSLLPAIISYRRKEHKAVK